MAVGNSSTVAELTTFPPMPLHEKMTNKPICASGMLTNIDAIPPAPPTAKIVTIRGDEIYDEWG